MTYATKIKLMMIFALLILFILIGLSISKPEWRIPILFCYFIEGYLVSSIGFDAIYFRNKALELQKQLNRRNLNVRN